MISMLLMVLGLVIVLIANVFVHIHDSLLTIMLLVTGGGLFGLGVGMDYEDRE